MNRSLLVALLALCCGAAFAQAPAGTVQRPSQETNPTAAGGAPADKAESKTEARKAEMPAAGSTMGAAAGSTGMGMKGMDADGDGMVTKKEWDSYHSAMWRKMNKGGKASMADVEAMMKGGPN